MGAPRPRALDGRLRRGGASLKQLVHDPSSGDVRLEEVPAPAARPRFVVVANRASLVSAGTERQAIEFGRESLLGKARSRPDLVGQVLTKVRTDGLVAAASAARHRLAEWQSLGYSSAGVVVAVGEGVSRVRVGDRVACAGQGHASHAEVVAVPEGFVARVPDGLPLDDAAFATLGAIALHAIHRADVRPGDRVAVVGCGLLGLLTVQLLRAYGCAVLASDVRKEAVAQALELGAELGVLADEDAAAAASGFTAGHGCDRAVVTASADDAAPLAAALAMTRRGGRVSVVGLLPIEADRRVLYEKEIEVTVAKSYGPGRDDAGYQRGDDWPPHLARWTVQRNMEEFLRLAALGAVTTAPLVGARVALGDAPAAYERLLAGTLGGTILLAYAEESARASPTVTYRTTPPVDGALGVALVGAGQFARGTLLPALKGLADLDYRVVASAGSLSAAQAAERFGFAKATTDPREALADPAVRLVLVATRHDQHARLTAEALRAGKDVFVEKPLALDLAGLRAVAEAGRAGGRLLVGFNRRHAPLVRELREAFRGRAGPLLATYRVNAGALPADHWLRDPAEGGGRILGEVCHFVDTLHAVVGSPIVRVAASGGGPVDAQDHLVATLEFADGSRGVVLYTGFGPPGLPKERLEVVGAGRAATLDNFRSLELVDGGRTRKSRALAQDKGHGAELAAFVEAIRRGAPSPVPLDELLLSSLATLAIPVALAAGEPVELGPFGEGIL